MDKITQAVTIRTHHAYAHTCPSLTPYTHSPQLPPLTHAYTPE